LHGTRLINRVRRNAPEDRQMSEVGQGSKKNARVSRGAPRRTMKNLVDAGRPIRPRHNTAFTDDQVRALAGGG
jgi:hypothetical protein